MPESCESTAPPIPRMPREPRYGWGQTVQAIVDLHNDGSHPEAGEDALLVACGSLGEIVRVGRHTEFDMPIYVVDFGTQVVGCTEDELSPAPVAADAGSA